MKIPVYIYQKIIDLKKPFILLIIITYIEFSNGKYELDGNKVFVLIDSYCTSLEEKKWEAHRRYIDIQLVVKNCEKMGYAPLQQMEQVSDYDQENDLIFYKGKGSFFIVNPGTFVIFFPHDVHMPGIAVDKPEIIKKIVIKIRVD